MYLLKVVKGYFIIKKDTFSISFKDKNYAIHLNRDRQNQYHGKKSVRRVIIVILWNFHEIK